MKVMTADELKKLLDEKISISEDTNHLTDESVKHVQEVYDNNLPEGITPKMAGAVNEYNCNFTAAYAESAGTLGINYILGNPDVAQIDLSTEVQGVEFKTLIARPTVENPTKEDWAEAFGFGIGHKRHDNFKSLNVILAEITEKEE